MKVTIRRRRPFTDDFDRDLSGKDPVAELGSRVERARAMLPLQADPALAQALSFGEIDKERRLQEWLRDQSRRQRKRLAKRALTSEYREHVQAARIRQQELADRRWHERAVAAQRRATSSDALIAMLHRKAVWMSRWMYGAMAVGLVWSAINVGTNYGRTFGPGGPRLAFWIVSFGVEAMVSIPILQIMDQATTAARIGQRVDRAKIIAFEVSLLVVTVGLNAGPHLQAGDALGVVLYSAAPVMVVVGLWLHTWLATRYARMIEGLSVPAAGAADRKSSRTGDQPSNVSTSNARDIPALSGVFAPRERSLDACERVARQMIAQRSAKVPEDHLVAVLRLAQAGWNANAIAVEMRRITAASIYRSTIDRHILCAKSMGLEIPVLESTATT